MLIKCGMYIYFYANESGCETFNWHCECNEGQNITFLDYEYKGYNVV